MKFRYWLAEIILDLDDWLAKKKIFFTWFVKDKDNHISLLSRLGFRLIGWWK